MLVIIIYILNFAQCDESTINIPALYNEIVLSEKKCPTNSLCNEKVNSNYDTVGTKECCQKKDERYIDNCKKFTIAYYLIDEISQKIEGLKDTNTQENTELLEVTILFKYIGLTKVQQIVFEKLISHTKIYDVPFEKLKSILKHFDSESSKYKEIHEIFSIEVPSNNSTPQEIELRVKDIQDAKELMETFQQRIQSDGTFIKDTSGSRFEPSDLNRQKDTMCEDYNETYKNVVFNDFNNASIPFNLVFELRINVKRKCNTDRKRR